MQETKIKEGLVGNERFDSNGLESAPDECPECGDHNTTTDNIGEVICESCGLVIDEMNLERKERRMYESSHVKKRKRTGPGQDVLLHDNGLTTRISQQNKDANGGPVSSRKSFLLRKWNHRVRVSNSKEQSLLRGMDSIKRMGGVLGLPQSIKERAAVLYRKTIKKSAPRGRSTEEVATALLYIASREKNVPRTLNEFCEEVGARTPRIHKLYKELKAKLGVTVDLIDPEQYIDKICNGLNLGQEARKKAKELVEESRKYNVPSGKSPNGLAGGAVYLACNHTSNEITQEEISDVADVTCVTIRTRYKELEDVNET